MPCLAPLHSSRFNRLVWLADARAIDWKHAGARLASPRVYHFVFNGRWMTGKLERKTRTRARCFWRARSITESGGKKIFFFFFFFFSCLPYNYCVCVDYVCVCVCVWIAIDSSPRPALVNWRGSPELILSDGTVITHTCVCSPLSSVMFTIFRWLYLPSTCSGSAIRNRYRASEGVQIAARTRPSSWRPRRRPPVAIEKKKKKRNQNQFLAKAKGERGKFSFFGREFHVPWFCIKDFRSTEVLANSFQGFVWLLLQRIVKCHFFTGQPCPFRALCLHS